MGTRTGELSTHAWAVLFGSPAGPNRVAHNGGPLSNFLLKLYVAGPSPKSERAIANLRRICEHELQGQYELEIIDVLQQPQLAEDDKILATPTLIKQLPPPLRRIIGDLSDTEKVLLGLEVQAVSGLPADIPAKHD